MTAQTPASQPLTPRRMLTVEQAAEALGIGRTTTYALVRSGDLDSVKVGRLRRVSATAIHAYTDRLTTAPHPADTDQEDQP